MNRTILATGFLALAACAAGPPKESSPEPSPQPQPVADTCGARALQHLVGRHRSEIPPAAKPELQRVACATCAITMDYNPERLNIFFDEATGIIQDVRCG